MNCWWADDSQRLILDNFDAIQDCPSKIYCEAIPFSPSSSWLHKSYGPKHLQGVKVVKGLQVGWEACSRTVSFDDTPLALACWGNLIVAGFLSGSIIILDATTGAPGSTLSGHTNLVSSLAISSDGISLVSGSHDRTVRLWDIQTGGVIRRFYGHTKCVLSVSISPDGITIVSGSEDCTIRWWNAQTGECYYTISGNYGICSISFSPTNPQLLISASKGNTVGNIVQQWNINGNKIGHEYEGFYAAFSPDGTHFVSLQGEAAMVWNSYSGAFVTKLQVPGSHLICCCFFPNKLIACASDTTIYIWDITSSDSHPIKSFDGGAESITSIAFSSALISSSLDKTVKFWQTNPSYSNPISTDSKSQPPPSASIMTISVQAKDHIAISWDEAGIVRTWDISTGLCKSSRKTSAGPCNRGGARLVAGRLLIVWCTTKKIHIQDINGKHAKKVDPVSDFSTTYIGISGDGSKVFLLDSKHIQALSTQTGQVVGEVRFEGELSNNPLIVDGLRVWVCFKNLTTQGWDFGVLGSTPVTLSNELLPSPCLYFIHTTTVGTTTYPSWVKDMVTGKDILQLPRRYGEPTAIHCDGQYLVAGYESGELLVLDFCQMFPQ